MPLVKTGAEVTLVVLIYRSLKWLDWCQKGVESSRNKAKYRWLVVANDATPEVLADPRVDVDFRNDNPREFYIPRVYRAWNEGVLNAVTPLVVMLNSDMWGSLGWLDELLIAKKADARTVPTSLLVESGRLESGMPEYVRDFGKTPDKFNVSAFETYANSIRRPGSTEAGRLFMPILVDRQEFFDIGGYPEGNPAGTTGDKDLISRYSDAGYRHITALGSVVAHIQLGESRYP